MQPWRFVEIQSALGLRFIQQYGDACQILECDNPALSRAIQSEHRPYPSSPPIRWGSSNNLCWPNVRKVPVAPAALALARSLSRVAAAIQTFTTSQTESASRIATVSAGSVSESLLRITRASTIVHVSASGPRWLECGGHGPHTPSSHPLTKASRSALTRSGSTIAIP
jgi:hypothetical protein